MQNILLKPVITEKSIAQTANRFYSFYIHTSANKYKVKDAVAKAFKVKVESVRIVNVHPKTRRRGRLVGQTRSYKKAIVKLAKDNKIEFFEKL